MFSTNELVQNQYHVKVPTSGLKQVIFITIGVFVQQTTITTLHVNIFVTTGLPIYGNGVPLENHLKLCLMEDRLEEDHLIETHLEEDHLIETHLEECHLIHMLDFMDG